MHLLYYEKTRSGLSSTMFNCYFYLDCFLSFRRLNLSGSNFFCSSHPQHNIPNTKRNSSSSNKKKNYSKEKKFSLPFRV